MKSKHCFYDKKAVYSYFDNYHNIDNLFYKCKITAFATDGYFIN